MTWFHTYITSGSLSSLFYILTLESFWKVKQEGLRLLSSSWLILFYSAVYPTSYSLKITILCQMLYL